jgi:CRISPR-associated protein Cas1
VYYSALAIDQPGSSLKRKSQCFVVYSNGIKKEYSSEKITQILFLVPSSISSSAINLAVEKNIDIVYLDWRGYPFARTYRPTLGGTTLTRRRQLEACSSPKGRYLACCFVGRKIWL